jgi:hypothetical protein
MRGDLQVVECLLELLFGGSTPCQKLAAKGDAAGYNAWHYAAASGSAEVVEMMFVWKRDMVCKECSLGGINSTLEHLLQEPARSWWKKHRMEYDGTTSAATDCVNALLGASGSVSRDILGGGGPTASCGLRRKPTLLTGSIMWPSPTRHATANPTAPVAAMRLGLADKLKSVLVGSGKAADAIDSAQMHVRSSPGRSSA